MSEYLYDEDYSPADDQEEARLWPLGVVILAIALIAVLWPLYRSDPIWLSTWLLIITDNTLHLAINYAALRWL